MGYHLGLLDVEQRRRVESAFPDTASLANARAAVRRLLAPLDTDGADPPADLSARVMARIESTQKTLPFPRSAVRMSETDGAAPRGGFNLRELVGLAAAVLIFAGILVPGYRTARQASYQAMCANHMRQVGSGIQQYADVFGGQFPYRGPITAAQTAAAAQGRRPAFIRLRNTQHFWPVIQQHFTPPGAFICPQREGDAPVDAALIDRLNRFPDPRNVSFSVQVIGDGWGRDSVDPRMPILADMNPIAEEPDGPGDLSPLNSRSHGHRGQNVLRADSAVFWAITPNVGIESDDIYRLIGVETYTGRELPRLRSDAFLVP